MTEEYYNYLSASANFEIYQLQKSGQTFLIDRKKYNANTLDKCLYGQIFGECNNNKATAFKKQNNIRLGFGLNRYDTSNETALEVLLQIKGHKGHTIEAFEILSQFCTFKRQETNTSIEYWEITYLDSEKKEKKDKNSAKKVLEAIANFYNILGYHKIIKIEMI